ncbi:hypothetical protein H5395_17715 [Paracoccus sp. MC1854]|uniref:hypothetical protein n=1 Tax=Paracoccus sp. MC1854 TaxID=2760306 RepID=UPI0015FEE658|nr:hypothetical protein [Paracoccus sp. MC1854]MBB1493287.1 hypothetical protein [Paracoccus sp. MC1854]
MTDEATSTTQQRGYVVGTVNSARLDVIGIKEALFEDQVIAAKIAKDYNLRSNATLYEQVSKTFGQQVVKRDDFKDDEVFEAATLAIASSMRRWSQVYRALPQIRRILKDYDPGEVARAAQDPAQRDGMVQALGALLGGVPARKHADWIIRFGESLTAAPRFYPSLLEVREAVRKRAPALSDAQLNAAVALLLARGSGPKSRASNGIAFNKVAGMGPPIASEFLRNLGWASFKPDRHIVRLLTAWLPEAERNEIADSVDWKPIFPRRARDAKEFLDFAVLGEKLTPPGLPLNQIDQLVWMMGVYVQKKPRTKRSP